MEGPDNGDALDVAKVLQRLSIERVPVFMAAASSREINSGAVIACFPLVLEYPS
jgi:hypothetical protein